MLKDCNFGCQIDVLIDTAEEANLLCCRLVAEQFFDMTTRIPSVREKKMSRRCTSFFRIQSASEREKTKKDKIFKGQKNPKILSEDLPAKNTG